MLTLVVPLLLSALRVLLAAGVLVTLVLFGRLATVGTVLVAGVLIRRATLGAVLAAGMFAAVVLLTRRATVGAMLATGVLTTRMTTVTGVLTPVVVLARRATFGTVLTLGTMLAGVLTPGAVLTGRTSTVAALGWLGRRRATLWPGPRRPFLSVNPVLGVHGGTPGLPIPAPPTPAARAMRSLAGLLLHHDLLLRASTHHGGR